MDFLFEFRLSMVLGCREYGIKSSSSFRSPWSRWLKMTTWLWCFLLNLLVFLKFCFFTYFRYERRKSQMIVSIEDEAAEAAEVANLMARRNSQVHIVSFLWFSLQLLCTFDSYQIKQARKGFWLPSAMKGIGYFQKLRIFLDFRGTLLGIFMRIFGGIFLEEFFWEDFFGENFFGRIFWEEFFGRN